MSRTPTWEAKSRASREKVDVVTTIMSSARATAFAPKSFCTTGLPTGRERA